MFPNSVRRLPRQQLACLLSQACKDRPSSHFRPGQAARAGQRLASGPHGSGPVQSVPPSTATAGMIGPQMGRKNYRPDHRPSPGHVRHSTVPGPPATELSSDGSRQFRYRSRTDRMEGRLMQLELSMSRGSEDLMNIILRA